ncbi:MAG: polysaccharide biosynthesis/export family protein [Parafilimonas sp.]
MNYSLSKNLLTNGFYFFLLYFASSCSPSKNVAYFQDLTDTSKIYSQAITQSYKVTLQPDDLIGINISSNNPEATAIFNMGGSVTETPQISPAVTGSSAITTSQSPNSYLIDKQGTIDFPVFGKLLVQGLTVPQLKDSLKVKLEKYLQDPIVNIRLLNYKVTVLGEVSHPATYTIPSERLTVIDAIGMAGDLTIYGKRENVLLIREEKGERKFIRMDLNSSNIFESPYYYLKQNDIIYVEPNKSKIAASDITQLRNISIATAAISLLIVIISRFR